MLLKKLIKRKPTDDLETYFLKSEIADTTISAMSFLNPQFDTQQVEELYLTTLLQFVSEKDLTELRDTLVSLADTKVKEVRELYKIYEGSN